MKSLNKADVARAYGKVGFNIFPCYQKIPLIKDNLRKATHEVEQIQEWWRTSPNARIGLPCESNHLLVLDFDLHKKGNENCLKDLADQTGLNLSAHPYRVQSVSGGVHLYYKYPSIEGQEVASGTNVLGRGVDIRAKGGFIISADGEDYALLDDKHGFNPEKLLEVPALPMELSNLLLKDDVKWDAAADQKVGTFWEERARIRSALREIPAENRDDWLKVGMAIHAASEGSEVGFGLWVSWSRTCKEKFNGREQRNTWNGFKQRENGIGLGWILRRARGNGWVDKDPVSLTAVTVPDAKAAKGRKLTTATMASMRAAYRVRGLSPSDEQWAAIEDPISTMEAMAEGTAAPVVYLSALDPGVGKTQGVTHFVQSLLASPEHTHVAMLICVGRLKEIATLVEGMNLRVTDYSVFVNDKSKEGKQLNALGNPNKGDARIMFTTQQMLESRGKRAKTFEAVTEFHWKGNARQVRVWDEAMLPGRPLTVNVTLIEGMTHVVGKAFPQLLQSINNLLAQIKSKKKGDFVDIPDFGQEAGVNAQLCAQIFDSAEKLTDEIRKAADDLWLLSGKTVSVTRDAAGNTVLDYEETLLAGLKPILVLDASGRIRQMYARWNQSRQGLVGLRNAAKNYSNLTPHVWRRPGSKDSWRSDYDELAGAVAKEVLREPTRRCLIVHPLKNRNFKVDVPFEINSRLTDRARKIVSYLHWGDHSASNDYRDIDKVILTTVMFREPSYYESIARLSGATRSDQPLEKEVYESIRAGERADLILQAVCRAAVRKPIGDGCHPCNLYIIAHPKHGIEDMLPAVFPGCGDVRDWLPVERKLRGKVKEAVDFIVARVKTHPYARLRFGTVWRHMLIDKNTFHQEIFNHPDFEGALAGKGIGIERKLGRSGNSFIKLRRATGFMFSLDMPAPPTNGFGLAALAVRRPVS